MIEKSESKKYENLFKLSDKFKQAIKEEFGSNTLKIELTINQGGIQNGKIEINIAK